MKRFSLIIILFLPFLGFLQLACDLEVRADQSTAVTGAKKNESSAEQNSSRPIFRTISPAEAAEIIKTRKELQIIDVRTPQERKQFRMANTKLVPVGDVVRGVFKADPSRPIMLICAVGGRSYVAGKIMSTRGYREVYNLDGGIESWRRAGLPIESGPENPRKQ